MSLQSRLRRRIFLRRGLIGAYNSSLRPVTRFLEDEAQPEVNPMKRIVRITVLILGLVGTYVAAATPQVPAQDKDSVPICPLPQPKNCKP